MTYKEPDFSFLILDYKKPVETMSLLWSIRKNVKFDYKVIYAHNGNDVDSDKDDYGYHYFREGLIDHFIQTKKNNGLGIGTRDLFAACFSQYSIYVQNDQYLGFQFTENDLQEIKVLLEHGYWKDKKIASVSLAGSPCGEGIYSERAHVIQTSRYKHMESEGLSFGGAGPYHDTEWREGQIQRYYKENGLIHFQFPKPLFIDNGRSAIRENPDGSKWKHFPDTKQLFLLSGPIKEKFVYPKFTDEEWEEVLKTQSWPDGKIPSVEEKDSFHYWN